MITNEENYPYYKAVLSNHPGIVPVQAMTIKIKLHYDQYGKIRPRVFCITAYNGLPIYCSVNGACVSKIYRLSDIIKNDETTFTIVKQRRKLYKFIIRNNANKQWCTDYYDDLMNSHCDTISDFFNDDIDLFCKTFLELIDRPIDYDNFL